MPDCLTNNLNQKVALILYQKNAFQRFIYYLEKDAKKKKLPIYLLYNMVTGSGKTLIMAGLILNLYQRGYRNFIFLVNSNNIIEKTKQIFLQKILVNTFLLIH